MLDSEIEAEEALHLLQDDMDMDGVMYDFMFESSSSEMEEEEERTRKGKSPNKDRDFVLANQLVIKHYFNGRDSIYDEKDFERRFRCPRSVYNRVHDALMGQDPFVHKKDCTGKMGVHPLVKLIACFGHIAHGDALDGEDEIPHDDDGCHWRHMSNMKNDTSVTFSFVFRATQMETAVNQQPRKLISPRVGEKKAKQYKDGEKIMDSPLYKKQIASLNNKMEDFFGRSKA